MEEVKLETKSHLEKMAKEVSFAFVFYTGKLKLQYFYPSSCFTVAEFKTGQRNATWVTSDWEAIQGGNGATGYATAGRLSFRPQRYWTSLW